MKIFFPAISLLASNPGLALRIWLTDTLMFFSRYAWAMDESVSPAAMVYSKPFSGGPPLGAGLPAGGATALGVVLFGGVATAHGLAELLNFLHDPFVVRHAFLVNFLELFGQLAQILLIGVNSCWAGSAARAARQFPWPAPRGVSVAPPAPPANPPRGRLICSAAPPPPRPARAKPGCRTAKPQPE